MRCPSKQGSNSQCKLTAGQRIGERVVKEHILQGDRVASTHLMYDDRLLTNARLNFHSIKRTKSDNSLLHPHYFTFPISANPPSLTSSAPHILPLDSDLNLNIPSRPLPSLIPSTILTLLPHSPLDLPITIPFTFHSLHRIRQSISCRRNIITTRHGSTIHIRISVITSESPRWLDITTGPATIPRRIGFLRTARTERTARAGLDIWLHGLTSIRERGSVRTTHLR